MSRRQAARAPKAHRSRPDRRDHVGQTGAIAIWFLLTLVFLLMFGAFALDAPRMFAVTGELQNDADAAALAGAGALTDSTSGLDWANAASSAQTAVQLNMSDAKTLVNGAVQVGYVDLAAATPVMMASSAVTLPAPAGEYLEPAVQVTVARNASNNGGLVPLLMGALLGTPAVSDSATSIAVIAPPATVPAGTLFPVAMDACLYANYWNFQTASPEIDPTTGQPYEFEFGNGQTYDGTCEAGQWTSFTTVQNNVPAIRGLIANGNPTALSIGDGIYLQPGMKTTLYSSVPVGEVVLVPVAAQILDKTFVSIVAFAPLMIDGSYGGSSKYIEGHLVPNYKIPTQATGVGSYNYGGYVAPRLAY